VIEAATGKPEKLGRRRLKGVISANYIQAMMTCRIFFCFPGADTGEWRGWLSPPPWARKNYITKNVTSQATLLAN